jgi:hypothetical protein
MFLTPSRFEKVKAIHKGVPGNLRAVSNVGKELCHTYPATIASLVCHAQEWTSLICRIFHNMNGPTTTVQNSCTKIEGILYASQYGQNLEARCLTIRLPCDSCDSLNCRQRSPTLRGSDVIQRIGRWRGEAKIVSC